MKNKNMIQTALVAALIIGIPHVTCASNNLNEEFKGNWSGSFTLKDGTEVVHTPTFTRMAFMTAGTGISIKARSFNGLSLSEHGIQLQTNSTRDEFVEALKRSGAY